jgi:hypothetical protein
MIKTNLNFVELSAMKSSKLMTAKQVSWPAKGNRHRKTDWEEIKVGNKS